MEGNIFYRDPENKLFLEIVVARRNSIILISFIYEINVSLLFLLSTTYSSNRFNASSHLETEQTVPPTAENSTMTTRGELDENLRGVNASPSVCPTGGTLDYVATITR